MTEGVEYGVTYRADAYTPPAMRAALARLDEQARLAAEMVDEEAFGALLEEIDAEGPPRTAPWPESVLEVIRKRVYGVRG